jgi:hypothetical protein
MARDGVWQVVKDDLSQGEEIATEVGSLNNIRPGDSVSQVGAPVQPVAMASALARLPPGMGAEAGPSPAMTMQDWCCPVHCPWCHMGLAKTDHGNLQLAYTAFAHSWTWRPT